jgi:hypothetical protein
MKKLLLSLTVLTMTLGISAQNVGIGTASPASSAKLEIDATDAGLLIPRVQLDDVSLAAPVSSPVEGLLIYNETGTEPVGFYYWNGAAWERLGGSDSDWVEAVGVVYNQTSDIGINTATPDGKLHILTDATDDYPRFWRASGAGSATTLLSLNSGAGSSNRGLFFAFNESGTSDYEINTFGAARDLVLAADDNYAVHIKASNTRVGIYESSPVTTLDVNGEIKVGNTGLSAAASNAGALRWNGTAIQFSDGATWADLGGGGDDLGNHTATQNIETGTNYISADGDNEGIFVESNGEVLISGTTLGPFFQFYSESFDNTLGTWTIIQQPAGGTTPGSPVSNGIWSFDVNTTISSNTGPSAPSDGTHYLYTETSSPTAFNDVFELENTFNFTSYSDVNLIFDYHMYFNGNASGTLEILANGSPVFSISGQQQTDETDPWITETVSLTSYAGQPFVDITLRFTVGNQGNAYDYDCGIDHFRLEGAVAGSGPLLTVGSNGDGSFAQANAWFTFSDMRWKRDFEQIPDALEKIEAISGYFYHWQNNDHEQNRQMGVIAQEIQAQFPEIVGKNQDGYLTVDYSKLTAPLIEAVKQLSKEVSLQNEQIEILKAQNGTLEVIMTENNQLRKEIEQIRELILLFSSSQISTD